MSSKTTEVVANNRLFDKKLLSMAVATAMFGSTGASLAATNINAATTVTGDLAINYTIDGGNDGASGPGTLTITGGTSTTSYLSQFNGTVDAGATAGSGSVVITGNLTMLGNVGSTNTTGNWTVEAGNTLVLEDSMTKFNAAK